MHLIKVAALPATQRYDALVATKVSCEINRMKFHAALVAILVMPPFLAAQGAQVTGATRAESKEIRCRVMEVFEDRHLAVRAVIFHQRDKADGPRLGSLLLAQSGRDVEFEMASGQKYRATVFRVRSAFGRGLMLLPANAPKLAADDELTLRVSGAD